MEDSVSLIWNAVHRLDRWLDRNGWSGYDPYDLREAPLFQALASRGTIPWASRSRDVLFTLDKYLPVFTRRLFRVKPRVNAKAMGLMAKGYLKLFRATGDSRYRKKAESCLDWLLKNPSEGYHGLCWGYPFDWQSHLLIPKGTPSGVVSSVVGDAFWEAYETFDDSSFLDICLSICRFFVEDLNRDRIEEDCLCFSYTPLDGFHVHNANLFVSEFLVRVGSKAGRDDLVRYGRLGSHYALREQNPDGSLYYWGKVQNAFNPFRVDHYHAGFEMRMLFGLWRSTHDESYFSALSDYYSFYLDNLIAIRDDRVMPRMTPRSTYPVNIHACAESILCNAILSKAFPRASRLLPPLCRFVIETMQTETGWFRYRILKTRFGLIPNNIPYLRWGQAWMLLALSSCLEALNGSNRAGP